MSKSLPRKVRSIFRGSARREADQEPTVLVVGRKEVGGHALYVPGAGAKLERLAEPPHAPIQGDLHRALPVEAGEPERLDDVAAHQLLLAEAGELEHVPAAREHPGLLVADDESGPRGGVVVLEQLEEKAEAAALARDRLVGQPFAPVVVDRARLAVRADEVGHAAMVARAFQRLGRETSTGAGNRAGAGRRTGSQPALAPEVDDLRDRRRHDPPPGPPVAEAPVELGDVPEVLAVEPDDEGR